MSGNKQKLFAIILYRNRKKMNRPKNIETTALGAAMLAGLKIGIWKSQEELLT